MDNTPTKREQEILDAIIRYTSEHGYSPSFRDIGRMVGLKSNATVYTHVSNMLGKGILETDEGPSCPRTLRVPGYKFVKIGGKEDESSNNVP